MGNTLLKEIVNQTLQKTSDVVHSADLEWNQGWGKVSLQGETSGDDGLSENLR